MEATRIGEIPIEAPPPKSSSRALLVQEAVFTRKPPLHLPFRICEIIDDFSHREFVLILRNLKCSKTTIEF